MGKLYASELLDPAEWVDMNAKDILDSVRDAGGWLKLFPKGIPNWLHKVRNYFNVEPKTLRLVDKNVTGHWMKDVRAHGKISGIVSKYTLSGDVYFDDEVEVWYQMGAGGTIYHWGGGVTWDVADAIHTQFGRTQKGVPIFKLICPDGTDGSKETIVSNPVIRKTQVVGPRGIETNLERSSKIGKTNQLVLVMNRLEKHMDHQGSYNFAETSVVGLKKHEKYDVNTHKKDGVYIDPPDRFEPLEDRIFFDYVLKRAGADIKKKQPQKTMTLKQQVEMDSRN